MNIQQNFLTLVDLLGFRAIHNSTQTLYTFLKDGETESETLTYQDLDQQAQAIAAQLHQLVKKGERALLLYPSGLEFISAFCGCLYAGVIAVPVEPPRPNRPMLRLEAIIENCEPQILLSTANLKTELLNRLVDKSIFDNLRWLATDTVNYNLASQWEQPKINAETLAFLQYTSGSTGIPKGVMVSHGNLLHNSEYIQTAFELTSDSISVSWLPHFHDMGLIDGILQPLYTGFRGILMPPKFFYQKPIRWLKAISHYRATHCGGPNFAYDLCTRQVTFSQKQELDLSSWDSAYNGSEPVSQEVLEQFSLAFADCGFSHSSFYPCYGLAESTLMVSGGKIREEPVYYQVDMEALEQNRVIDWGSGESEKPRQLVGSGKPWLDTKVLIVNPESFAPCDRSQIGEIWISGTSVAQGYWNRLEETQKTFKAHLLINDVNDDLHGDHEPFLRTGDFGFVRGGELFVTGRLKDMIIIRGRNFYPQDIELTVQKSSPALRSHCGASFSIEVKGREQLAIVQEVERTHRQSIDINEVIGNISQALMEHHEVSAYAVLLVNPGQVPKTSSGKLRRKACKQAFLEDSLEVIGGRIGNG